MNKLSFSFAKNRAEELPNDLWNNYVLPLNYAESNLLNFYKSTVVVGGRGTGKTMFLKYHCYPTMLSPKRTSISSEDLNQIGFHWRPDTGFAQMITEEYLDKSWKVIFETYIGLSILIEFSKFIKYFIKSNYDDNKLKKELEELILPSHIKELLKENEDIRLINLDEVCELKRSILSDWINFPEGRPPIYFEAKSKWLYFINSVLKKFEIFENTIFHIFIDEFENLTTDQQIVINTWIKHSENPLIFHIAYKKHATVTTKTLGVEQIVDVNDYRIIDLEKIYENNFDVLACEIILSKMNHFFEQKNDFDLSNQEFIKNRHESDYQDLITNKVKSIFPTLSIIQIVEEIFQDTALSNKLKEQIKDGLKNKSSKIPWNKFYNKSNKQETIINALLLHRERIKPNELLEKFEGKNTLFYRDLINNNMLGAILYFYSIFQNKDCPYFAGFERFLLLAQSNIRYLLELCYQSIVEFENSTVCKEITFDTLIIDTSIQAKATKYSCKTQLEKVPGLGSYGKNLQKIAVRLGKIFILSHKRKSQSIAELNHFSLKNCQVSDIEDAKINLLINECKVWGILKEEKNNKRTGSQDSATNFYILHPIFAAHFGISPRKKRKKDFTLEEFTTIMIGNEEEYQKLHDYYDKMWQVEDSNVIPYNSNSLLDYIK